MTNPTTPFSWQMPTSTDLVTDLPADFEVFGQAVATSMADLLGGTTGQVLAKASNTNMDFSWVTTDDANAIQNAIVNAKGDIIGASANDVPAITSVGANDTTLFADSTAATGLSWGGNWAAFTPSFNNFTLGNGTVIARTRKSNKVQQVFIEITLGSTSVVSNFPQLVLPAAYVYPFVARNGYHYDVSTDTRYLSTGWTQYGVFYFGSEVTSGAYNSWGYVFPTVQFTWATGDIISYNFTYEVA